MTLKKYSTFPDIDFRSVWKSVKEDNPVLDQDNFFLYASGRSALCHGVSCLPATTRKKILVPFYHCGVEVEAILRAGFEVEFYVLKDNLEIDFIWLENNVTADVGAILIIHFFGFPQPLDEIRSFCQRKKLFLIEDCAHALYSGVGSSLLGTFGDITIYSIMKTVGLPNGGGLLVNNREFALPEKGKAYFNTALIKKIIRSALEFEANRNQGSNGWVSKFLQSHDKKQTPSSQGSQQETNNKLWYYEVAQYHYRHAISFVSRYFLKPMAVEQIVNQRRKNYNSLMRQISWDKVMQPLFGQCSEGVCPLCLPVRVQNSDSWVENVSREKMFPFVFGRFSHPSFNDERFSQVKEFQQGIVGLPIHQQLDENDMQEISCRINILLDKRK